MADRAAVVACMATAALVLTAGCVGVFADTSPEPTAEEILNGVQQKGFEDLYAEIHTRTSGLDEYQGKIDFLALGLRFTADEETVRKEGMSHRLWLSSSGESRIETYEDGERVSVNILTHSEFIEYDQEEGWYETRDADFEINDSFGSGRPYEGVDFEYVGEEKVSGHGTHVIRGTTDGDPRTAENTSYPEWVEEIRVWVEKDHSHPIKFRYEGENKSVQKTYKNVEFDSGISDGVFEFEPPEGARDISETVEVYTPEGGGGYGEKGEKEVLKDVTEEAGFEVPSLELDGYELLRVKTSLEYEGDPDVTLNYGTVAETERNASATLLIDGPREGLLKAGKKVEMDGGTGMFRETGGDLGINIFGWSCGGHRYTLMAEFGAEGMVETAEGVC
jgi:hypothetical protein